MDAENQLALRAESNVRDLLPEQREDGGRGDDDVGFVGLIHCSAGKVLSQRVLRGDLQPVRIEPNVVLVAEAPCVVVRDVIELRADEQCAEAFEGGGLHGGGCYQARRIGLGTGGRESRSVAAGCAEVNVITLTVARTAHRKAFVVMALRVARRLPC